MADNVNLSMGPTQEGKTPITGSILETPITVTNESFDVNLKTNERPSGEFTSVDFFGSIKGQNAALQGKIDAEVLKLPKPPTYTDLKNLIESNIETWFPNNGEKYKFQAYIDSSGKTTFSADFLGNIGITNEGSADILYSPGLELIYNYWLEEGFTTQTLLAITERYRNKPGKWSEKLINFTLDPLRRVNDYLMGYIKDLRIGELLTSEERSLEYQNQYGYFISGRNYNAGLEVRSTFHSAFNKLLAECAKYYKQADDRTIDADGFPVLSALQELNIILATGDINQAVSFAKKARTEIIVEQQILNRDEIGEYLKERPMIPYKYVWMRRVDAMKNLQRWNPVSIRTFNELAETGEIILLSVRYVDWANISDQDFAEAWAANFRNEIQLYINRYYSVTGVDLSLERVSAEDAQTRNLLPSVLIRKRLQHRF